MDTKHVDSRNKRLKIGRACYTCRAKKIKCDGQRPCMQCKARNRPCTFYKDGSFDPDQQPPEQHKADGSSAANGPENIDNSSLLFSDTNDANTARSKRRNPLLESRTSNALASLGEGIRRITLFDGSHGKPFNDAEPFGNFIKWIAEPALPSRYNGSIEMPSREAQLRLLDLFFNECYETIHIVPKNYFISQLSTKGPFITPLLLNAMYAHISRFIDDPSLPKAEVFFYRAKRLLDDFMDVPRVSTVVALCLMGLYEPRASTSGGSSVYCRTWMYSGMAYRMCLELGLHNDSNIAKDLSQADIQMRRRVFWCAYCLDKLHSGGCERPWMLPSSMCHVSKPTAMPEDDPEEQKIIEGLSHRIDLTIVVEKLISIQDRIQYVCSAELFNDCIKPVVRDLFSWLQKLPPSMQWTPTHSVPIDTILKLPPPRPMVGYLHIIYNVCILEILFRHWNVTKNRSAHREAAACLTVLVEYACLRPATIVWFTFLMQAVLATIKVQVKDLHSSDAAVANQARNLYNRSVLTIHKLRQYVTIPNSDKFLQQLTGAKDSPNGDLKNGQPAVKLVKEPFTPIYLDEEAITAERNAQSLPFQSIETLGSMYFAPPSYEQSIADGISDYPPIPLPTCDWPNSGSKPNLPQPPQIASQAPPHHVRLQSYPSNPTLEQHTTNFILPSQTITQGQGDDMAKYDLNRLVSLVDTGSQPIDPSMVAHSQAIWRFPDE